MTKSIEEIWQQASYEEQSTLSEYLHRKESESQDLLHQLCIKYQLNNKWMGLGAILSFCLLPLFGMFYLALALGFTFFGVFLLGRAQIKELSELDKAMSCYDYLQGYRAYMERAKRHYGNIYRVIYPGLYVALLVEFFSSTGGVYFLNDLIADGSPVYIGLPLEVLIFGGISTLLIAVSARALYLKEVNVFYGSELRKLDALIDELKPLH
ncbi:hypothetical protein [Pseudoalteromonas sp. GB56]